MNTLPCTERQSEGKCQICQEKLQSTTFCNRSLTSVRPCHHLFHTDCIYRWSTEHTTCPLDQRGILSLELQLPLPPGWQNLMVNSAFNGEHDQVLALLKRGATVDAGRPQSQTPFAVAGKNTHFSIAQMLAFHGAKDPIGQFYMGYMYLTGTGVKKDQSRATSWFVKAADQGLPDAQLVLGHMYWTGRGARRDTTRAIDWLKKAVAQEHVRSMGLLGCIYLEDDPPNRDVTRGLQLLEKAVQKGSLVAMNKLGVMHWMGEHVKVDLLKAQHLLQQAADGNFVCGKISLARFYLDMNDKEKLPQVTALLQSAAGLEDPEAMSLLGYVYWHHLQEPLRAFDMFHKAARLGEPGSHYQLGLMYDAGEGTAKDPAQALHHFQQAAERGDVNAQFRLGVIHSLGSDVPKDLNKARQWFGKAAEKGHKKARERLYQVLQPPPQPDSVSTAKKKTKPPKRLQTKPKSMPNVSLTP